MKTPEELEDELFCLNYELKTLSSIITGGKLERWLPGFTDPVTHSDHEQRYRWVASYAKGKTVLDVACGTGMGSYLLATEGAAERVTGWDIEAEAIRYASIRHRSPNLSFSVQDATTVEPGVWADLVVSFETIEHLSNPDLFLTSMKNVLKPGGHFIVSTPISHLDIDHDPRNPYHLHEWGFSRFRELISGVFRVDSVFLQLHTPIPYDFYERILRQLNRKAFLSVPTIIEKYDGQIPEKQLGRRRRGYQLLVCSRIS